MKRLIGVISVDSGQVVICDPCYIDSQWKHEEFNDSRRYLHKDDNNVLEFRRDFQKYDEVIQMYDRSMNDMIAAGDVKELAPIPAHHNFSYNACCKKTTGPEGMGQLDHEMGQEGVAVVAGRFGGDGIFPVYADIDSDGMVKSITIKFE